LNQTAFHFSRQDAWTFYEILTPSEREQWQIVYRFRPPRPPNELHHELTMSEVLSYLPYCPISVADAVANMRLPIYSNITADLQCFKLHKTRLTNILTHHEGAWML